MVTSLTRSEFQSSLKGKAIDVADAQGAAREALSKADLDKSGSVHGAREVGELFREVDRLDANGDASSILAHDGTAPTSAGILADQTRQLAKPKLKRGLADRETRSDFAGDLRRQEVPLDQLPEATRDLVAGADLDGDGRLAGPTETARAWSAIDHLDDNGDVGSIRARQDGVATEQGRALKDVRGAARPDPNAPDTVVSWPINEAAMGRARDTGLGAKVPAKVAQHREMYERASELTGVPASMIAAIHGNESGFGTFTPSTKGPESGFGLDDRWITRSWGNQQLAKHGLGSWQRGKDTATGRLQSAVIAGAHLKRQAATVGVEISDQMTPKEIAGAITAYTSSGSMARRAKSSGTSWMFNPTDDNPLPRHPGGTSRTSSGTVRVAPQRKPGLLRWDTLIPLVEEQLKKPGVA
jgi:hypothetical protein